MSTETFTQEEKAERDALARVAEHEALWSGSGAAQFANAYLPEVVTVELARYINSVTALVTCVERRLEAAIRAQRPAPLPEPTTDTIPERRQREVVSVAHVSLYDAPDDHQLLSAHYEDGRRVKAIIPDVVAQLILDHRAAMRYAVDALAIGDIEYATETLRKALGR